MRDDETLIFMHIPKTGGTSVSCILTQWYPPDEVFHIRSDQHAAAPRFSPHCGSEDEFVRLPSARRARFRCILGHARFGIHLAVPRPFRYFTLLRDPLQRYVSQVAQYNRMAAAGELGDAAVPVALSAFRDVKPNQFSNPQARWITGTTPADVGAMGPAELLRRAELNLTQFFCAVGVVEQIDRTLYALAALLGRPRPALRVENASPQRPSLYDLTDLQRTELEEANQVDARLWKLAADWLDRDAARPAAPMAPPTHRPQGLLTAFARLIKRRGAA